jgi:hypothetical protein
MTGDPRQYRLHADECIRAAESAASLEAREEFIALAHVSLRLAAQFENGNTLDASSEEYVAEFSALTRMA